MNINRLLDTQKSASSNNANNQNLILGSQANGQGISKSVQRPSIKSGESQKRQLQITNSNISQASTNTNNMSNNNNNINSVLNSLGYAKTNSTASSSAVTNNNNGFNSQSNINNNKNIANINGKQSMMSGTN